MERLALSEIEREHITNDIFGSVQKESSQNLIIDAREIMEAKLRQMPSELKTAYMEALASCPNIVNVESNPYAMLRADDYEPALAAQRLVKYWETRLSLFGQYAFLPMTVEGALQSDIAALETNFCEMLPHDKNGRRVIYYDRSRISNAVYNRDSIVRVMWYAIHKVSNEENAQNAGFVLLTDCRQDTLHSFDRKLVKLLIDSCIRVAPIRLRALHICCSTHRSILSFVCPAMKMIVGKRIRGRTILHSGDPKELLYDLEDYGMPANILPISLGGSYHSDVFRVQENHHLETSATLLNQFARTA